MYNLKELYTSDTTLSQMIDWTPRSNELRGKIQSDPPPPWKSWKKLLSVRILYGPVRKLYGPVRHFYGPWPCRWWTGPYRWWTGSYRWWTGPCRWRTGPCRWQTESNFVTIYIKKDVAGEKILISKKRLLGELWKKKFSPPPGPHMGVWIKKSDRSKCERDRTNCERDRSKGARDRTDCERDRTECERKATSFTIFRGARGQIEFSPITRY